MVVVLVVVACVVRTMSGEAGSGQGEGGEAGSGQSEGGEDRHGRESQCKNEIAFAVVVKVHGKVLSSCRRVNLEG